MATRKGLVKKTALEAYSRPRSHGIIAIKLREDDELVDVVVAKPGDEVVLATANGLAIRFHQEDARAMGRNSSGVKGIALTPGDELVGMVVADPDATLLTACEHGFGKRTLFGPNEEIKGGSLEGEVEEEDSEAEEPTAESVAEKAGATDTPEESEASEGDASEGDEAVSTSNRYRVQRRGGKGLRDIKTTARNGKVIGIVPVKDEDELMMMTTGGKIQRIAAREVSVIGRNTQGVRIMSLDEGDRLAAVVRVPREESAGE
jgi:DNA gyrase subunit A